MTLEMSSQEEMTSAPESPSCPYAKALQDDVSSPASLPGLVELKECPAFTGECPFKDAKSPEEVSKKLQELPPSHLQADGTFYKTLEYFHKTNDGTSSDNPLPSPPESVSGGCPVKNSLPDEVVGWSFNHTMEQYSLAVVMGRLAQEWEDKEAVDVEGMTIGGEIPPSAVVEVPKKDDSVELSPTSAKRRSRRLSDALKTGTAQAHEAAEAVHFVKNFIRGKIDRDLFGLLIAQLFHVYHKLEDALNEKAPLHFATCHYPVELSRAAALEEDVEFWHTTSSPPISPATQDYMDRIEYLAKEKPLLLLAHSYTRYLGDLSGGKVLARVARRALQLTPDDAGLAFYHFEQISSFKLFKDRYRNSLNSLQLSEEQIGELVQEANIAFLLNMRLFEELDMVGGIPGATVRSLRDVYNSTAAAISQIPDESSQCPFAGMAASAGNKVPADHGASPEQPVGECPWPFMLLHNPRKGLMAWQTWLAIGLALGLLNHSATMTSNTSRS